LIGIDTLWLWSQPQDMRAGAGRLLNIVVNTVGAARAHPGCLFADLRSTRVKLLVHDGFSVVRHAWPARGAFRQAGTFARAASGCHAATNRAAV
jgi:hypothetical protein